MKSLLRYQPLLAAVILCQISVRGQDFAPANVSGRTALVIITSGTGAFATAGGYRLVLTGTGYQVVPLTATVLPSSGSYTYSKTGANSAAVSIVNGQTGISAIQSIAFSSPTNGIFSTSSVVGTQTGSFIWEGEPVSPLPAISVQPIDYIVVEGSVINLSVVATGAPPLSYQWRKNGLVIPGATTAGLRGTVTANEAGTYSVTVSNAAGAVNSNSAVVNVTAPNQPRLINLSVRSVVPTGGVGLLAGFVVGGTANKTVVIRGVGPALTGFGVTDTMPDPNINLFNAANVVIAANDNWLASDGGAMARVGAFPLASGSRDAALVATLAPGNYTVQVIGAGAIGGAALVEVYEVP